MLTQLILDEAQVAEGAREWYAGQQRWRAWNAVLLNHVKQGRLREDEYEAIVAAALAAVHDRNRRWLQDPDIW